MVKRLPALGTLSTVSRPTVHGDQIVGDAEAQSHALRETTGRQSTIKRA